MSNDKPLSNKASCHPGRSYYCGNKDAIPGKVLVNENGY